MGKTSITLLGLLFLAISGMAQPVPAPATTSQATNLVVQDSYMSPARVGDFWNDVGIPFVLSNGGGTIASNSIAKNNGIGTNLTVYGTLTSTNFDSKIESATNSVLATASNIFSIKGSAGGIVPAPATTSQATNLVTQDVYMSPARVGDFWYDVAIPYIAANGGGSGNSTNAIANNNGAGTNLTVYGTLTSTNMNAKISAVTNSSLSVTVLSNRPSPTAIEIQSAGGLTNNETGLTLSGTFTNGTFYGNGAGLTNVTGTGGATNAIANLNGFGTNTTLTTLFYSSNTLGLVISGAGTFSVNGTYYFNGSDFTNTTTTTNYVHNANGSSGFYWEIYPGDPLYFSPVYLSSSGSPLGPYVANGGNGISPAPTVNYILITNSTVNFSPTNGGTFIGTFAGNGSGLTNLNVTGSGITNLLATNAILPSVSGLVGFIPTNSASGSSVTTNQFASTNYVIAATNNLGNSVAVSMTNAANSFVGFSPTFYGANQYPSAIYLKDTNTTSKVEWFYASGGQWQLVMNANPVYNGIQFYTNGAISFNAGAVALNGVGVVYLDTNAVRLKQVFDSGDEDILVVSNRIIYGNGSGLTNLNYSNITNQPALVTLVTATNISSNMVYLGTNGLGGGGGISLTQATNVALPTATNVFNGLIIGATNNLLPTMTNIATAVGGGISAVTATNIASNIVLNATNNFKVVVTNTALVSATNVVNALVSGATFSIQVENELDERNNYTLHFVNGMLSSYTQP